MRRRTSGIDINGWHDMAVRDWDLDGGPSDATVIDGGIGTVAIEDAAGTWIGGPQALLAPHGRGLGWGALGAPERRVALRGIWDRLPAGGSALLATVEALGRGADQAVLAVPDLAGFDEAAQEAALTLLRGHRRSHRLLWRPVAAFLAALKDARISTERAGASYGFLIHAGTGFEFQTLRLRADSEHPGHFAPEREGFGRSLWPELGLAAFAEAAERAVARANPLLTREPTEQSRLPIGLLTSRVQPGFREILRHNNGNWIECIAPQVPLPEALAGWSLPEGAGFEGLDAVFFASPLAGPARDALEEKLLGEVPRLAILDWACLAQGCLAAGQLIDRGLPHYFDRLTPIRLAVLNAATHEPEFADLIDSEATLPANREYVSPPFTALQWGAGKSELAFYILKGDRELRHWHVDLPQGPPRDVPVELRLRQTPGQSWARLFLTSSAWEPLQRAPLFLDWAALNPLDQTPEQVLALLRVPPPVVPLRVIEESHVDLWFGSDRVRGLIPILDFAEARGERALEAVVNGLRRPFRDPLSGKRYWAISTDGAFPEGVPEHETARLLALLEAAARRVAAASSRAPLGGNRDLLLLTWTFTRCPDPVQDRLVEAVEAWVRKSPHPLLSGAGSAMVVVQGAGRCVTGVPRLHRLIAALAAATPNANTLNALAMILSRREEAPLALTAPLVQGLAEMLVAELADLLAKRSFKLRFRNTLLAMAGLFRFREIERFALVATQDPIAARLHSQIERLITQLAAERAHVPAREEKQDLLRALLAYLQGAGNPDILRIIETDEADEEGE